MARFAGTGSGLVYGLAAELRTPLLELKLQAELRGDGESCEIAKHALKLFDGFLYMNDQSLHSEQLDFVPCSLAAETRDAIRSLEDLAGVYGVKIELTTKRNNKPVALNRRAYAYATHGLLYAAITSLQNSPGSVVSVSVSGGQQPKLQVTSDSFTKEAFSKKALTNNLQKVSLPHFNGVGSGVVLAEKLYDLLDTKMIWTGRDSFYAVFKQTKQMSLIDIAA